MNSANWSRRAWLRAIPGLAALPVRATESVFHATEVQHIAPTVPDLARSRDFYRRVLGVRVLQESERACFLGLRRNFLALLRGEKPAMNHFSIAIEGYDAGVVADKFRQGGYKPFERAPNIWAILDPDGLQLHPSAPNHRLDEIEAGYAADPNPDSLFHGVDVNHVALRVADVDRARDFYQQLFGLPVLTHSGSSCFLGVGQNFLALFQGRAGRMDHYCFSIDNYEVGAVTEKLRANDLRPRRSGNRVYFPDPDGLTVQLAATNHAP